MTLSDLYGASSWTVTGNLDIVLEPVCLKYDKSKEAYIECDIRDASGWCNGRVSKKLMKTISLKCCNGTYDEMAEALLNEWVER